MEIWSILSQNEAVIFKDLIRKLIQGRNCFNEREKNLRQKPHTTEGPRRTELEAHTREGILYLYHRKGTTIHFSWLKLQIIHIMTTFSLEPST